MQQVKSSIGTGVLEGMRLAQREWALTPLARRVRLIGRLRRTLASGARDLAETVPVTLPGSLRRTVADTLAAEVLPLIEACRFLEREAESILRSRNLGAQGLPAWLAGFTSGIDSQVERAPWGIVLILAAGNYPLLLAGVQALQALVAGNAVLWKPAHGAQTAAFALRTLLLESGLNPELLILLDADVEAAQEAIAGGVDHVILTGSAATGKAVLRQLAETLTPATMELSGCDAVFVLPGADFLRTIQALGFGLRFNGSFTCMAPRRVFLVGLSKPQTVEFEARLAAALADLAPVPVSAKTYHLLRDMIEDARIQGADVLLNGVEEELSLHPQAGVTLITRAAPSLLSMQTDIFAPVLSVMRTTDAEEALASNAACPYALTAAIFGPEREARRLASRLRVGNILINDLIVPTVDPRIPFGGRGQSGFGVTRGAEGLLAMTTPRTVQVRTGLKLPGRSPRAYEPTGEGHIEFFAGLAEMLHGGGLRARLRGLKRLIGAAGNLR
jgi:aldehyde dehydrogenase (NAD+)